jgi:two-component system phosphate regulon sensor histidine kinase PhoR
MDWFLLIVILVLVAALIWSASRNAALRGLLMEYTAVLRRAGEGAAPVSALPADVTGLEELSNAVLALRSGFDFQLSTLESERARLAAVLEQMTDAVLIADPQGRVQFANPAAERLGRLSLIGRSITEVLRHHQLIQAWQRCHESGEIQVESAELPATRQFVQLIVIPDRYTPGGSLLLIQDLTRIRRLETVRRDFVSNLSHELRTPLASVKALAETLQDGALEDPPAARHFLDQMLVEVDALTQMVSELLELSRIESGQLAFDLQPVSALDLLTSAAGRMQVQAERAGVSLRVDCPPDLPRIRADAARLEQVLVNLIHNGVKFTPPGGEVLLTAERAESALQLGVIDSGTGINSDELPRIFERFYKSDPSRSGGGTGLGLSIARHLVESHGGRIWAESPPGHGSRFLFTIPLA